MRTYVSPQNVQSCSVCEPTQPWLSSARVGQSAPHQGFSASGCTGHSPPAQFSPTPEPVTHAPSRQVRPPSPHSASPAHARVQIRAPPSHVAGSTQRVPESWAAQASSASQATVQTPQRHSSPAAHSDETSHTLRKCDSPETLGEGD